VRDIGPGFERVPLPGFLKKEIMQTFLRDVHHYLFNVTYSPRAAATFAVQDEIRSRMVGALVDAHARGTPPYVVVSHSMGTVVAYDCLKRVPGCPPVDELMTIGCPLGLDEVQDELRPEWTREDGYPRHGLKGLWANVYDRFDPVCGFDPVLTGDFKRGSLEIVEDINEQNWGKWRHDITKYLAGPKLRARLQKMLV
jgi:pimeloyl-ACP methyl ester carboxylesterase